MGRAMAVFKKTPGSSDSSWPGFQDLDPISAGFVDAMLFWTWPSIVSAVIYFIMVYKDYPNAWLGATVPGAIIYAWQYGLFDYFE